MFGYSIRYSTKKVDGLKLEMMKLGVPFLSQIVAKTNTPSAGMGQI